MGRGRCRLGPGCVDRSGAHGPGAALRFGFLAVEAALAIGLTIIDGWVFEPGHVFEVSAEPRLSVPADRGVSIGVSPGPV